MFSSPWQLSGGGSTGVSLGSREGFAVAVSNEGLLPTLSPTQCVTPGRSLRGSRAQFPCFLPLPLSPPLSPCSQACSEDGPNLLTPTLSRGGTLARGICGSGLPGPPLVAPAQPPWASLETAWGCRAHHPSFQPRAPGAPWQPRDQRQKRGFVPGEGEARDSVQGAAPRPKNVARLRDPWNQGACGLRRAACARLAPSAPPVPTGAASCPSEDPSSL